MDGTVFYYVGGALVAAALVLSYIGIRAKGSFPSSKGQMAGILAVFSVIVVGTAAYAVANAREEQDHRNEELAKEEGTAAEDVQSGEDQQGSPGGGAPDAAVTTVDVASPEDGSLVFEPDGLQVDAGTITIAYSNPSSVPHNINIEDASGQVLAKSQTITASDLELTAELSPGEYVYFCSVPGHRQAGMEGTLIVQ